MKPAEYDAWYDTPRGHWIGDAEFRLLHRLLASRRPETLLDVGCGTGWFSRRFADAGFAVTGVDVDEESLAWARARGGARIEYRIGDARQLPFQDKSFDCVASIAALCFVDDWPRAIREIARVCRRRFVLGLLHRHGLLWREKGRGDSGSSYAGAHWRTRAEIEATLHALPVRDVKFRYAVFDPAASILARVLERIVPSRVPLGSFLAVAANLVDEPRQSA